MASDQFYLFAALASFSSDVQEKLRKVHSPEAIIALAADHGYTITLEQLSYYAHRLNGDHWIWVNKSDDWRQQFFGRERQLDLQPA
ncbi:MAG: Nif11-like leader peptide family natural product precursor [Synechococcaceae cyanobacterium]|nr:Nif11-like leader peptide family natural product precursor [Synechococcaceae cyanobacterium]